MSIERPLKIPGRRTVLTKRMILNSQENTKSGHAAARWLGVSYNTYRKWAKYYGIFEQHLNQAGNGIKKGWGTFKIKIDDFINGKRPLPKNYTFKVFKRRLIEEGYILEECGICGYNETNLSTEKVCLNIDFEDGDSKNLSIENVRLLCPNCYLSVNGFFHAAKTFCK